jgi:hypothetical protein
VEARAEWSGVRPLLGVIETPSMRPDGTLIDTPGYDAATGFVYIPGRAYPNVAARPSVADARRALADLLEPFAEFPVRSQADHCVLVAAILTLVARPAIQGAVPAVINDSSTRGSGKSLCARATALIAHGREPAMMSWPADESELEKVLGSYGLRAATLIDFDNITTPFGGGPLDKVLTCADQVELRVLGYSDVVSVAWRAMIQGTGNNVVILGDTTRRALVCRLEPMLERPEERTDYTIPDLVAWCRENHPRLVCSALTLLRAYVVAGRPAQGLAGWGSFEAWRDLVANAIVWAGGADVMACRPTIAGEDDPETAALRTFVQQWPLLVPNGSTIASVIGQLYSPERMRGNAPPDGYDALREALETLAPPGRNGLAPAALKLGKALGKHRRRVISGRYIDRAPLHDRAGVVVWIVREVDQ